MLVRYIRLYRYHRLTRKELLRENENLRSVISAKRREIRRLGELNAALQAKIEIVQQQACDRVLEAQRLMGMSHITRSTDERIQELRYQPYVEAKRAGDRPEDVLSPAERHSYDEEYARHVKQGEAMGLNHAEINAAWERHKLQIIDGLGAN